MQVNVGNTEFTRVILDEIKYSVKDFMIKNHRYDALYTLKNMEIDNIKNSSYYELLKRTGRNIQIELKITDPNNLQI